MIEADLLFNLPPIEQVDLFLTKFSAPTLIYVF